MRKLIRLEADRAASALDGAVRAQAQVVIITPVADTPVNGFIVSADADALLVQLTGHLEFDVTRLVDQECEVQIHADQHYRFTGRIVGTPHWGKTQAVAVSRPQFVALIERRRFRRASLAPSSSVNIKWDSNGTRHSQTATILNVSAEGLACRVQADIAACIDAEGRISASFQLPWQDEVLNLDATVSNRTPASEGCVILGLQFVVSSESAVQLARLREALVTPRSSLAKASVSR